MSPDLRLHLEPDSDPISGSLAYPGGPERSFTGWIELAAALEEAHHGESLEVSAHGREAAEAEPDEASSERAPGPEKPPST